MSNVATTSSTSGAAARYATAIFELAKENHALDAIERNLSELGALIEDNPDLSRVIGSPAYSRADQAAAMNALAQKAGYETLTRNFLGLMAQKGRLYMLPGAIAGFQQMLANERGETSAEVISARPLNDMQRNRLAEQLKDAVGKDVRIEESVDPSLLGGLIVKIGSRMIDASLKSKLGKLQRAMKEAH